MKRRIKGQKRRRKVVANLPSGVGVTETVNGNGDTWWRVRLGKRFTGGAILKKDFKTVADAREWIDAHIAQAERTGTETHDGLGITELAEAKNAFARLKALKGTPLSLTEAVSYAIKFAAPPAGVLEWFDYLVDEIKDGKPVMKDGKPVKTTIAGAITRWLQAMKAKTNPPADSTLATYHVSTRLFANEMAKTRPHQVTKDDILDYILDDDWEPSTQAHHLRNLKVFFMWLHRSRHAGSNPSFDIAEPKDNKPIVALTPKQAADLMAACDDDIAPSIALGLFAGLRTSEIRRLDWSEIGETEIEIKATKTKTRRNRMVPILPPLVAWLARYKGERVGAVAPRNWREKFEAVTEAAGWRDAEGESTWPRNAMRHSYGSYRLPDLGDDGKLAHEMGNSPEMIFKHYRKVIGSADVKAFWAIRPDSKPVKNVLQFKAA